MDEAREQQTRATADRVLEFAEEVEASGEVTIDGTALEKARAALHAWVDGITGVVITPAFGRVTVIHDGRESTISSPDLPYAMSEPRGDR